MIRSTSSRAANFLRGSFCSNNYNSTIVLMATSPSQVTTFRSLSSHKSTPDLCDEYEDTIRVLDPIFRNYGGKQRFSGTAVTVKCFEDNSKIKQLAKTPGDGRVIVVDGGGSRRRALLGDQVALDAQNSNWSGLVIYGSIRDADEIGELFDLGVQALGTHPVKTIKRDEGQIGIPVTFAGVTIQPGDFVSCDNNGIVVNDVPMDVSGDA